jgi:hypothetical protein
VHLLAGLDYAVAVQGPTHRAYRSSSFFARHRTDWQALKKSARLHDAGFWYVSFGGSRTCDLPA